MRLAGADAGAGVEARADSSTAWRGETRAGDTSTENAGERAVDTDTSTARGGETRAGSGTDRADLSGGRGRADGSKRAGNGGRELDLTVRDLRHDSNSASSGWERVGDGGANGVDGG